MPAVSRELAHDPFTKTVIFSFCSPWSLYQRLLSCEAFCGSPCLGKVSLSQLIVRCSTSASQKGSLFLCILPSLLVKLSSYSLLSSFCSLCCTHRQSISRAREPRKTFLLSHFQCPISKIGYGHAQRSRPHLTGHAESIFLFCCT